VAATAGTRDTASLQTPTFVEPRGRIETRFRRAALGLWILAGIIEVALVSRFIAMWLYGQDATGDASSAIVTDLYRLTTPFIYLLTKSANVSLPPAGLGHIFDVACLLAINILFFGVLGLTKLGIWTGRNLDRRRTRRLREKTVKSDQVGPEESSASRIPVDSGAR
jgi:hypothetical protein